MLLPLLLAGCAAPTSYMGVNIAATAPVTPFTELARRAMGGDKQAQLDLGIAYEGGCGVPRDLRRAVLLYRLAASNSGGRQWIYVPGVGGQAGRVMAFDWGPNQPGLAVARLRLTKLEVAR